MNFQGCSSWLGGSCRDLCLTSRTTKEQSTKEYVRHRITNHRSDFCTTQATQQVFSQFHAQCYASLQNEQETVGGKRLLYFEVSWRKSIWYDQNVYHAHWSLTTCTSALYFPSPGARERREKEDPGNKVVSSRGALATVHDHALIIIIIIIIIITTTTIIIMITILL